MPDKRQLIHDAFITAVFRFLGYVASCDGAINRDEINRLKIYMKKMNLVEDEQRRALKCRCELFQIEYIVMCI